MNKNIGSIITIICLTIIVIVLSTGLTLALVYRDNLNLNFNFNFKVSSNEKLLEQQYGQKNININTTSQNITFLEAEDDLIQVEVYGKEKHDEVEINDGKELTINYNSKKHIHFCIGFCDSEIIKIYLPKTYINDIKIDTHSGNITSDINLNNIDINHTSGNIKLKNVNNIESSGTSGNIKLKNAETADIKLTSGNIRFNNANDITLKTTSGNIKVGNVNNININCTSGNIEVNNVSNQINIKSTTANILIKKADIHSKSYINATSGNVTIRDINNIYIDTQTKSGIVKNKASIDRFSDIELSVKTTSGNIRIK